MFMLTVDKDAIINLLMQRRMTCREFSDVSGLSYPLIIRLVRSDQRCRLDTVAHVAAALNVDYRSILKEDHRD